MKGEGFNDGVALVAIGGAYALCHYVVNSLPSCAVGRLLESFHRR
jgi:hypothetical protein